MKDWKFVARKYWRRIHLKKFPEPLVLKNLKRMKGGTFLDIGANTGMYSLALRKNFSRIYSFEPDPSFFEELRNNCSKKNNIVPVQAAVSEKNGWVHLNYSKEMCPTIVEHGTLAPASNPERNTSYSVEKGVLVKTVTVDSFISEMGIPKVDLIKVDVELAEFLVLEGARGAISKRLIRNMVIELHDRERRDELETLLGEADYEMRWIDPDHVLASIRNDIEYDSV